MSQNPPPSPKSYVSGTPPPSSYWKQHPVPEEPPLSPSHSREAQALLGTVVPDNKRKANIGALKALGSFCINKFRPHRRSLLEIDDVGRILEETRCLIFPNGEGGYLPAGYSQWTTAQLKHVRFYLIEFVSNYKNTKTGSDIAPTTLKTYVLGFQRGFIMLWGYVLKLLTGPVFNCPEKGFVSVIENKAREQQREGKHVVGHNVLSREDLVLLYSSRSLSKDTPRVFLTRLVFTVGILTGMRQTALATLTTSQFRKTKIRDDMVWVISGAVGSNSGASKTSKGGWKAIGQKISEVCVWDESYNEGTINFYSDIDEYMAIRTALEVGTDRFFLTINAKATNLSEFFKRQHLGKNSFLSCVKDACIAEGIEGSGQKGLVTTHGLRGTLATLLFENGHSDSSVAMRTGHRDPRSLKSYQHLRGNEGIQQQRDIFGKENGPIRKRAKYETALDSVSKPDDLDSDVMSRMPFSNIGAVNGGTVNLTVHYHSTDNP